MANIQNVDYEAIPAKATQIREKGEAINSELTASYNVISNLRASWYGQRYNALTVAFNNLIPEINSLLELVVGEIPFALETVANNYAQVDRGSPVVSAQKAVPAKMPEIAASTEKGMRFVTGEVETTKTQVMNSFSKAKDMMNEAETIFNQVDWQSEAAETFRSRFSQIKTHIITSFDSINTEFEKLMSQTLADIQAAEGANTVQ